MKVQLLTDYTILLWRYIFRTLSPDEKEKLEKHVEESDELMYVFEQSTDAENHKKGAQFLDMIDLKKAHSRVLFKGKGRMKFKVTASASIDFPARIVQFQKWPKPFKVAAGIAAIVATTIMITMNHSKSTAPITGNGDTNTQKVNATGQGHIAYHPSIDLRSDSVINIKDIKEGEVISNGDFIAQMQNGQLNCSVNNKTGIGQSHTFITPSGATAKVLLPDASSVALNALSSIRVVAAAGGILKVIVTGEAFVESSSSASSQLFLEVKDRMTIEVAKETQMNVTAYDDESSIFTSILKSNGESKVIAGGKTAFLKLNQQAKFHGDSLIIVNMDTNTAESTKAWKDGLFDLRYNLETLMRQLSRWYDLDIVYENNKIPVRNFGGGGVKRDTRLEDMLSMLRLNKLNVRLEGRKLTIGEELLVDK